MAHTIQLVDNNPQTHCCKTDPLSHPFMASTQQGTKKRKITQLNGTKLPHHGRIWHGIRKAPEPDLQMSSPSLSNGKTLAVPVTFPAHGAEDGVKGSELACNRNTTSYSRPATLGPSDVPPQLIKWPV